MVNDFDSHLRLLGSFGTFARNLALTRPDMNGTLTELEKEIIAILRAEKDYLSSTEVLGRLPESKRPRGKNAICLLLLTLVRKGLVARHGCSKKYTRYTVAEAREFNIYEHWPFTMKRNHAWLADQG